MSPPPSQFTCLTGWEIISSFHCNVFLLFALSSLQVLALHLCFLNIPNFFLFFLFSFWDVMIHACGLDSASVNEIFILFVYAQSNLHVSTMIWENSPQSAHMHHFYRAKLKHLTARSKWWKHIFDWREALKWDSPFISNTPSTFSTLAWDDFQPIACILFCFFWRGEFTDSSLQS